MRFSQLSKVREASLIIPSEVLALRLLLLARTCVRRRRWLLLAGEGLDHVLDRLLDDALLTGNGPLLFFGRGVVVTAAQFTLAKRLEGTVDTGGELGRLAHVVGILQHLRPCARRFRVKEGRCSRYRRYRFCRRYGSVFAQSNPTKDTGVPCSSWPHTPC